VNIARNAELADQRELVERLELECHDEVLVVDYDELLVLLVPGHHRNLVNWAGQS
jgi:hypothetical protein